ncbi:hypothetical protein JW992_03920, partial [candidate division KSB1 bacterium]|nr:hypothetical protein [candidate division KSB1 bacterium]
MNCFSIRTRFFRVLLLTGLTAAFSNCQRAAEQPDWAESFEGRYGQVEVGGPLAAIECHHSRPLPVRISFYEPVANSLDLSIGYWERDRSRPIAAVIRIDGKSISLHDSSWRYITTPGWVRFEAIVNEVHISCSWRFGETIAATGWELEFVNLTRRTRRIEIDQSIALVLRTCHTFAVKHPTQIRAKSTSAIAFFDDAETDSCALWIARLDDPIAPIRIDSLDTELAPQVKQGQIKDDFYLAPQATQTRTLLIGHSSGSKADEAIDSALRHWHRDCRRYARRLEKAVSDVERFSPPDPELEQTARWSLAVMEANRHAIDGRILPMPCPAEYNFFFTHDLLLTHLGTVWVDLERVRTDLLALADLCPTDSILLHAYYWKDGEYQSEFCGSDNWNPLWLAELLARYYLRSGDSQTVHRLYPLMSAGLDRAVRERLHNGLMT